MGAKQINHKHDMPGRKLKHHDKYLQRLELYCKACDIKIKYVDKEIGGGAYDPHLRKLYVDEDLLESAEVAVFLHELGHSLDDTLVPTKASKKLSKAYKAVYSGRSSRKQLRAVIRCEKRAWHYARGIAKKLRIKLGVWFDAVEKYCLKNYKS